MEYKKKTLEDRFWSKVRRGEPNECWLWTDHCNNNGYAMIAVNRKDRNASRVCWVLHNGEIPDKLHVLHRCDNPLCVNPNHLFLGTPRDNMVDCLTKGRIRSAIVSAEQVIEIRRLYAVGDITQADLAKQFGMSRRGISLITTRTTWDHVT